MPVEAPIRVPGVEQRAVVWTPLERAFVGKLSQNRAGVELVVSHSTPHLNNRQITTLVSSEDAMVHVYNAEAFATQKVKFQNPQDFRTINLSGFPEDTSDAIIQGQLGYHDSFILLDNREVTEQPRETIAELRDRLDGQVQERLGA